MNCVYTLQNVYLYLIHDWRKQFKNVEFLIFFFFLLLKNIICSHLQILLALEFLHTLGLVHRNIKPENIFININGYLRLADFNMAKPIGRGRTYTLCGTPYYMAPEIITYKGHGLSVDFWSLGVLLYEMVAGYTPFFSQETSVLFENITLGKYKISKSFSPSFKNLIEGMIEVSYKMYQKNSIKNLITRQC